MTRREHRMLSREYTSRTGKKNARNPGECRQMGREQRGQRTGRRKTHLREIFSRSFAKANKRITRNADPEATGPRCRNTPTVFSERRTLPTAQRRRKATLTIQLGKGILPMIRDTEGQTTGSVRRWRAPESHTRDWETEDRMGGAKRGHRHPDHATR